MEPDPQAQLDLTADPQSGIQPDPAVTQQPPLQVLPNEPAEPLTLEEQMDALRKETATKFEEMETANRNALHQKELEIARMQGQLQGGGGQQTQPTLPFNTPEQWQAHGNVVRAAAQMVENAQLDERGEALRTQLGQHAQVANQEYQTWLPTHQQLQQQRQLKQFQLENWIQQNQLDPNSPEVDALRRSAQGEVTETDILQRMLEEKRQALATAGGQAAQQYTSQQLGAGTTIGSPIAKPIPTTAQGRVPTEEQKQALMDQSIRESQLRIVPSEDRISDPDFDKNLFGVS